MYIYIYIFNKFSSALLSAQWIKPDFQEATCVLSCKTMQLRTYAQKDTVWSYSQDMIVINSECTGIDTCNIL